MFKVLSIEDEISIAKAMVESFGKHGMVLEVVRDGEEGLTKALDWNPHLMLVDILLPRMDGIEMIRQLREDPWGKDADVMVLTNLVDDQKRAEADRLNVLDYLIKSNTRLEDLVLRSKLHLAQYHV